MSSLKKILVPTDLSEMSLSVEEVLRSLLGNRDVEVYLLHILESVSPHQTPYLDASSETALRDREKEAGLRLEKIGQRMLPRSVRVVPVVLRGDPVRLIIGYAQEKHCDVIVMATHGRTGLAHILVGSVAEKVVRHSSVPVLSVKPKALQAQVVALADVEEQLHVR